MVQLWMPVRRRAFGESDGGQEFEMVKGAIVCRFCMLEQNKDYLTELDSAIGDADHGINMDRGFKR